MRGRTKLSILLLGIALLTLLAAAPLQADGDTDEAGTDAAAAGLDRDLPEIFAPRVGDAPPEISPSPFTLLTPIRNLLSGPLWLMAADLNVQPLTAPLGKRGITPRPGLAWRSLQEVFVAPLLPEVSTPAAPANQALVPFRDPAPSFSRDILISRDFSNSPLQTEPHLAVNPNDPEHLIMGTIDYNFPNVSSYVSIDGGETWEGPNQPQFLRDDFVSGGDPVLGFDREGNAYFAFISIGVEEYSVGPAVDFAVVSSIAVSKSEDGGFTWAEPVSSARSGLRTDLVPDPTGRVRGEVVLTFLDKPWMDIGPHPTDKSRDMIYITYTEFAERFGIFHIGELPFFGVPIVETTIKLVHSEDGGITWSAPVSVSPTVRRIFGDTPEAEAEGTAGATVAGSLQEEEEEPSAVGSKRTVQGSQPAVTPDGTVYVAWMDTTNDKAFEGLAEIYVARSDDAGQTFSRPVRAAALNEPGFAPRTAFFRYWGSVFPQITTGPEGNVYIIYTAIPPDKKSDDGDIYVLRSLDRGQTWSRPRRLNDDSTDHLQFFPAITVDPNGVVHAMWGDMRDDRAEVRYHIYYSRSEDKGETWGFVDEELDFRTQNARVTDFPSNPNKGFPGGRFIGDYFSIKATEDDVYMVWADTRLAEFGPINQKIGFTRRTPIQAPEVFISPPAGPGGQSVTLQGFNFQPEINVFIQVGGAIINTERTNDQGRFTTQVFIPISGEGAHQVNIFDDSGNFATSSFFMEFGFDNVKKAQDDLARQFQDLDERVQSLQTNVASTVQSGTQELRDTLQGVSTSLAELSAQEAEALSGADEGGGAAWWLFALSVVLAALVGSGAALIGYRLWVSRNSTPPGPWQPVGS